MPIGSGKYRGLMLTPNMLLILPTKKSAYLKKPSSDKLITIDDIKATFDFAVPLNLSMGMAKA
ncbi:hypothetical protein ACFLUJ_01500 [Chloroflexota bacterium]